MAVGLFVNLGSLKREYFDDNGNGQKPRDSVVQFKGIVSRET
jgi:hypothetical protein